LPEQRQNEDRQRRQLREPEGRRPQRLTTRDIGRHRPDNERDRASDPEHGVGAAPAASIVRALAKHMISDAKIKLQQLRSAMARTVGIG
jgi:hypothetical protein